MGSVDDERKVDPVYSHLVDSLNANLNDEEGSPEAVAWADSCLNKYVDSTYTDWSSVQDALLEFVSTQPGTLDSATPDSSWLLVDNENSGQTVDNEIVHSKTNVGNLELNRSSEVDEDFMDDGIEEAESSGSSEDDEDDLISGFKKVRKARGKSRVKNVFQPHYTEDIVKDENCDSGIDSSLATEELEPSSEDLFKVWELEIPDEEDDFTSQLNKALSDIPPATESAVEEPAYMKGLLNVSVDELIAGLGDLSLDQITK